MARSQDTIFAPSSGATPSGVAVMRISGSQVATIAEQLAGGLPRPRVATLREIRDREGLVIDQALVLFFPCPHSFTGEDCLELQVHGSRAVVASLSALLSGFDDTRPAEAGEFSRRAFDNGKMDLVEIEGLADLIAAETEMQRRLAVEQSGGHLSALYRGWMDRLTRCRALIEAELDFPDEEDVPVSVSATVWENVDAIAREIEQHLGRHRSAEIVRDGFRIVIAGRPNAGKSSLLNAFARRDVAIVTDIEGTTRDLISIDLDIDGYLVRLTDTAGLRDTEDYVEREGVKRAIRSAADADLVLVLKDIDDPLPFPEIDSPAIQLKVATKADKRPTQSDELDLVVSVKDDKGIDSLTKRISGILAEQVNYAGEASAVRERQVDLLCEAHDLLEAAAQNHSMSLELRAEDLRIVSHLFGKITGFVDVEDLLDLIFSEFCIGK